MNTYQPPDYRAFRWRRRHRRLVAAALLMAAIACFAAAAWLATSHAPAPPTVTFPTATPTNGLPDDAEARRIIDAELAAGRPVPPSVRLYYGYPVTSGELDQLLREGSIAPLAIITGHYENGQPVIDSITTPIPATPTPSGGQV